jgi:tRNA dimethylallyltransferase
VNLEPRTLRRFFVIAGPTAVGKSELAVEIAERLETEIVGADAFQIYQGLDVLSGKPSPALQSRVKHHLIGILPPTETCDAARYAVLADEIIEDLNRQGLIPLVVGGSGFYIDSLLKPLPALSPADPDLRTRLANEPVEALLRELESTDPVAYATIDRRNRRRVQRAIEVIRSTGRPFSAFQREVASDVPGLLLNRERSDLHTRINERVRWMLTHGAIEEVVSAPELSPTASQMIGIRQIQQFLRREISEEECAQLIQAATRRYAKRQTTWFKQQGFTLFDAEASADAAADFFKKHMGGATSNQ